MIGIGALKEFGDGSAEVKSMRTHPDHLRRGVAALLLGHIAAEAGARGLTRLSLETGSGAAFEPALALYRNYGFVDGEAFSDYRSRAPSTNSFTWSSLPKAAAAPSTAIAAQSQSPCRDRIRSMASSPRGECCRQTDP